MTVNGEPVNGTAEVPSGSTLEFSSSRVGFAGGAGGSYGVVVMDHEALARSGLSGIDTYHYNLAWVFEGVYIEQPQRDAGSMWAA